MSADWSNHLLLNRFRVDVRLTGAGHAYRAWDIAQAKPVTLHFLPTPLEDEARRALEEKARSLAKIAQPGLLPFYGLFEIGSDSFWVDGHAEGPSLSYLHEPVPLAEALIYLKALAPQLDTIHRAGWAHALRPQNIYISRAGRIHLGGLFYAVSLLQRQNDIRTLAEIFVHLLGGDLEKRNLPEFLLRILPRALKPTAESHFDSAGEFFLTVCLACRVQAETLPEYLPASDSPSAGLRNNWQYLPPLSAPRPVIVKQPEKTGRSQPSAWGWLLGLLALAAGAASLWWLIPAPNLSATPAAISIQPSSSPLAQPSNMPLPSATSLSTSAAPDGLGGRIVFTCTRREINHLCMVLPRGGEIALLTAERAHDFYPVFSPDGGMVMFSSNRGGAFNLYLMLLQSDILTKLTENLGEISASAFSFDGSLIAFANSVEGQPADLWLMTREAANPRRLYDGTGNIASMAWSPNGKSIAFVMSQPETPGMYEAYLLDIESGQVSSVTNGRLVGAGGSIDWSPDGQFLLFFAGAPGENEIIRYEILTGEFLQLSSGGNNAAPSFSPDGQWIVFNSQRTGNAEIFIMRPDGSDVRQLTDDPDPDWQPRWGR
jgi:roadblock/LC7 domain-containing protein